MVCSKWALAAPIGGNLRPVVAWQRTSLRSHVHHRFHRDDQARHEAEIAAAAEASAGEIRHLGVFVHLPPDAVADKGLDHREAVLLDVVSPFRGPLRSTTCAGPSTDGQVQDVAGSRPAAAAPRDRPRRPAKVAAASPHQPFSRQPVSMLTMSPSTSFRRPGMPCTTSSLIEMQVTAGKGTGPGTPLNSGSAWCSAKKPSTAASISAVVTPGRSSDLATWMRFPDQQAGLAHLGDFSRRS